MRYLVSVFTFLLIPFSFLSAEISSEIDFNAKMENFDANVVEIGQYINKLYSSISLRGDRINKVLREKFSQNPDEFKGCIFTI